MNKQQKYKRMQSNIEKAILNAAVTNLIAKHYNQLRKELVKVPEDLDVFNDTYLKLTYKYNPDKDFREQFKWLFRQLKGAYYRDDRCQHTYTINENRLTIPDFIKDEECVTDKDVDLVSKLKAVCHIQ